MTGSGCTNPHCENGAEYLGPSPQDRRPCPTCNGTGMTFSPVTAMRWPCSDCTEGQDTTLRDPVGITEIAERLGVQRATVDKWRTRGLLPEPWWVISGTPVWEWVAISVWAQRTGRL